MAKIKTIKIIPQLKNSTCKSVYSQKNRKIGRHIHQNNIKSTVVQKRHLLDFKSKMVTLCITNCENSTKKSFTATGRGTLSVKIYSMKLPFLISWFWMHCRHAALASMGLKIAFVFSHLIGASVLQCECACSVKFGQARWMTKKPI